jgi:predicted small lipoprotein YifL
MKKILALVLALIMVLSLVACGGKTEEPAPAAKEEAAAAP